MASLGGVSGSNTISSLMNSANMISGLASGLDTESMIEQLVQSYQMKINQLNQKVTKTEWKQDAYRSIIANMYSFSSKYTSYTSNTNLLSASFFSNAVKVAALGKYADTVSASGKTTSNISLNAVHQLATSAQYRTSSNLISGDGTSIEASAGVDLNGETELSVLNGSLTLTYGSQNITISFDQVADVKAMDEIRTKLAEEQGVDEDKVDDAEVLAGLINQKLSGQTISLSGGKAEDATDRIQVTGKNGRISFSDKSTAGNSVFISSASDSVAEALGIKDALDDAEQDWEKPKSFTLPDKLTVNVDNKEYLSGRIMNMSLDGITKTITLPRIESDDDGSYFVDADGNELKDESGNRLEYNAENYTKLLNDAVQDAFKGKVEVSNTATDGESLQLRFRVQEGSNLVINAGVGETLGIGQIATSYLNTNKTLGELLGDNLDGLTSNGEQDKDGNDLYDFVLNGVKVGSYSKNSTLAELMNDINKSDAGVTVSYSQTTKNFLFETKETGADSEIKMGDGLAKAMFGVSANSSDKASKAFEGVDWGEEGSQKFTFETPDAKASFDVAKDATMDDIVSDLNKSMFSALGYTASFDKSTGKIVMNKGDSEVELKIKGADGEELKYRVDSQVSYTAGQDAIFNVTVNGETMQMTRSSNSVNIDGLTINMNETFNTKVDDDGNPLLDDDKRYQVENSKESVTFKTSTDSDKIIDAIKSMVADYNAMMSEIKSAYSTMPYRTSKGSFANYEPLTEDDMEGMSESAIERYEEKAKQGILFGDQTLSALYTKLNQAFSFSNTADVDTLKGMGITVSYSLSDYSQAVTIDEDKLRAMLDSDPDRVADLFTKTDGIMDRMKTQLDNYGKTTGEPKGILVQRAGTPLSSLSLLSNTWQSEIDNYASQIEKWQSRLETQVERYTSQFTRLETLINQMNSQSSTLAGLLGGAS